MDVVQSLETAKAFENFQVWEMAGTARKNIKINASSNLDKLFVNETMFS